MPDIFGRATPVEESLDGFKAAVDKKTARRRRQVFRPASQKRILTQAELDEAARQSALEAAKRQGERQEYEEGGSFL